MKRRGFSLIELVVALSAVLILSAILFPVFARSQDCEKEPSCEQNLRQVALAIKQYISDYDERFPLVKVTSTPYGWADAVQPYIPNAQRLQCPAEPQVPAPKATSKNVGYTDYFYNSRLSNIEEPKLEYIASTIMLGDAIPGDARQHSTGGTAQGPGVAKLVNSANAGIGAATRHDSGAYYAFADGHIKWFKGTDANTCPSIKNVSPALKGNLPTFAIK